jgi:hypothetical protein
VTGSERERFLSKRIIQATFPDVQTEGTSEKEKEIYIRTIIMNFRV